MKYDVKDRTICFRLSSRKYNEFVKKCRRENVSISERITKLLQNDLEGSR